jgi:hypothetical protein
MVPLTDKNHTFASGLAVMEHCNDWPLPSQLYEKLSLRRLRSCKDGCRLRRRVDTPLPVVDVIRTPTCAEEQSIIGLCSKEFFVSVSQIRLKWISLQNKEEHTYPNMLDIKHLLQKVGNNEKYDDVLCTITRIKYVLQISFREITKELYNDEHHNFYNLYTIANSILTTTVAGVIDKNLPFLKREYETTLATIVRRLALKYYSLQHKILNQKESVRFMKFYNDTIGLPFVYTSKEDFLRYELEILCACNWTIPLWNSWDIIICFRQRVENFVIFYEAQNEPDDLGENTLEEIMNWNKSWKEIWKNCVYYLYQ